MTISIVKTIGNTGRDFVSIATFATWLKTQDLVAQDAMLYAYVYDDQPSSKTQGLEIVPKTHSTTQYCIIQPAPGLGVNDLNTTGPLDYGTSGVELAVSFVASTQNLIIRPGVSVRGFRIHVTGGPGNDTTNSPGIFLGKSGYFTSNRLAELRYNRIWCEHNGAMSRAIGTGEYAQGGMILDNLFIHTAGTGFSCVLNYGTLVERNTFVRVGTAKGYPATNGVDSTLRDNVFVGCSPTPSLGLPATANTKITNNYTDTPMTGNAGGFTVVADGSLVEAAPGDYRIKTTSAAVAGASAAGATKTFDMLNSYRGSAPDAGAFQRIMQATPPTPVATITSQTITDQTIVFAGTIVNEVASGTASISKGGVQVGNGLSVTITGNQFSVTFAFIPGGNYDAPVITFSNDGGVGAPAGGAAPFTIANPVIPTATVTKQYVVGRKITLIGTLAGAPQSGSVTIPVGATPNGAVAQVATPITIIGNTFTVTLRDLPYGNYGVPVLTLTNGAGTGPAATGAATFTIATLNIPVEPGVTTKVVGTGGDFATLKDFATWLSSRNMVANNEIVHAYVISDQAWLNSTDSASFVLPSGGADATHYCIISPAPGMSVNEIHKNDPFNYGEAGIELSLSMAAIFNLGNSVILEGFRISFANVAGWSNRNVISITSSGRSNVGNAGIIRRCRIRSYMDGTTNAAVVTGEYATPGSFVDNYVEHVSGSAATMVVDYGIAARNTVVRRGAAQGFTAFKFSATGSGPTITDNALIGCGGTPISVPTAAVPGFKFYSNYTDTTLAKSSFGITQANNLVVDPLTDLRPQAVTSVLIGNASIDAISTNDIVGKNRGPQPDVGAWQLNGFTPLPNAIILSQVIDGTTVTISGTVSNAPLSGTATLLPDATNPDGANSVGPTAVALDGNGNFSVTWNDVSPGNYKVPLIVFINSGGTSQPATNGSTISILVIEGNPRPPDTPTTPGAGAAPIITIDASTLVGQALTMNGTVNLQNDATGKVELYFDSIPSGTTQGPFAVTLNGGNWSYSGTPTIYKYRVRIVATANGQPAIATQDFAILRATNVIPLPLK